MKTSVWFLFLLFISGILPAPDAGYFDRPLSKSRLTSLASDSIFIPFIPNLYARNAVELFYRMRGSKRAWYTDSSRTSAADSLLDFVMDAGKFALVPAEFKAAFLDSLSRLPYSQASANLLDVLLTDAFFRLADQLHAGRVEQRSMYPRAKSLVDDSLLVAGLERAAGNGSFQRELSGFEPDNTHYHKLLELFSSMLSYYEGALLSSEERRLRETELIRVAVNIERWRWFGEPMPHRYLMVNIPAYSMAVYENGDPVLESRVIVGRKNNPTPVLSSLIECMTIYPYWHVPRSIATRELLPLIKEDPAYLIRNRFEVLTQNGTVANPAEINWESMNPGNFPYRLRQREGPANSLGIIKFQFENSEAVYLHDTNAKALFNTERRAYSHGCVRVGKADELAHYLVRYDSGIIAPAMLHRYLNTQIRRDISLHKPLPIYIQYFTADGSAIYEDVYEKDGALMASFRELFPGDSDTPENFYLLSLKSPAGERLHLFPGMRRRPRK